MKSGDFDIRSKRMSLNLIEYLKHGFPFGVITTFLVLGLQTIFVTLSTLYLLMVTSTFSAPDILTSAFASSVIFVLLILLGAIILMFIYGRMNAILTEKVWNEKQSLSWDRLIGQGMTLSILLMIIHLPLFPFYWLWQTDMLLQIAFVAIYIPLVSLLDGLIAKFIATLQF